MKRTGGGRGQAPMVRGSSQKVSDKGWGTQTPGPARFAS